MSSKDIFSKHLPNIKLATKLDADGFEIPVSFGISVNTSKN